VYAGCATLIGAKMTSRSADLPVEDVEGVGEPDECGVGVGSRTVQEVVDLRLAARVATGDGGHDCPGLRVGR
jgi:hypothetical protein